MRIVNLTPHGLNVVDRNGNIVVIPPSGAVARVASSDVPAWRIDDTFDVVKTSFGDVDGLPDRTHDTVFVVSRIVKSAVTDRDDVVCPGPLLRDADGNVVGCKGFSY
jgi:hypothetical protein